MKYPDEFVKEYQKFLIHKNATGEKVPNLASQVTDFKNAVDYANSVLVKKNIRDFTPEEFLDFIMQVHKLASPNLYKTLPKGKQPEISGEIRHEMSLELKHYPEAGKYFQGIGSEHVFGMARFLREHHPQPDVDVGLEFLSGYYKIIWSMDFDEENRAIFKRRVTLDFLTKGMTPDQAQNFLNKYAPLVKKPNPPQDWVIAHAEISKKFDSDLSPTEKTALAKLFWVRDCDNVRERTLKFASEFIESLKRGDDPLEMFARFSYRFIHVHPFTNGNSRVMHIILNPILFEKKLPPLFLGNVFPTREELYVNYFHPEDEDSILPAFVDVLRKAIDLQQKEGRLYQKTQLTIKSGNSEWKLYPVDKLTGEFKGHKLLFFNFTSATKDTAGKFLVELTEDGFDAKLRKAPSGNPSIVVDLTNSSSTLKL